MAGGGVVMLDTWNGIDVDGFQREDYGLGGDVQSRPGGGRSLRLVGIVGY